MLVRVMVELVANATHRKDNQNQDYRDCISNLFQLMANICVYGKSQQGTTTLSVITSYHIVIDQGQ